MKQELSQARGSLQVRFRYSRQGCSPPYYLEVHHRDVRIRAASEKGAGGSSTPENNDSSPAELTVDQCTRKAAIRLAKIEEKENKTRGVYKGEWLKCRPSPTRHYPRRA